MAVVAEPTPAYFAVPELLLLTAVGCFLAARQARKIEINHGAE